ncbi:carbon-nitrogen hydrolase [Oceanobacillus arenosus]|uniref:Carbon-nitrogen hydrolase n=1 Tax=Oceanobacillus arenosus TaxID=1229153 RepID=A0A3D8PZ72_9BACI|nr:carbon-nitrogen family hydrolase [Oceanobacillus arenosus]RDW21324.1 carbon-nitrogen hydrolase [Oceanobacillus arenosus]
MKFSVFQMEIIPGNPKQNRDKVENWVREVVQNERPDTIVLPEMWTTSYTLTKLNVLADDMGEPTKTFLSKLASEYHLNIIGGSVANKVGDKIYNTSLVFNSKGELVYEYNKIHLVPMLNEPLYLTGGTKKVETFELDGIKMGLIICYDLRFPELARSLALAGAEVLIVVAEWPTARKNHWTSLQIARAIENQMYVISSNNIGSLDGVDYAGASMIIDPWGEVLCQGSNTNEETITGVLDAARVSEVRKDVPIFESRVPNLY